LRSFDSNDDISDSESEDVDDDNDNDNDDDDDDEEEVVEKVVFQRPRSSAYGMTPFCNSVPPTFDGLANGSEKDVQKASVDSKISGDVVSTSTDFSSGTLTSEEAQLETKDVENDKTETETEKIPLIVESKPTIDTSSKELPESTKLLEHSVKPENLSPSPRKSEEITPLNAIEKPTVEQEASQQVPTVVSAEVSAESKIETVIETTTKPATAESPVISPLPSNPDSPANTSTAQSPEQPTNSIEQSEAQSANAQEITMTSETSSETEIVETKSERAASEPTTNGSHTEDNLCKSSETLQRRTARINMSPDEFKTILKEEGQKIGADDGQKSIVRNSPDRKTFLAGSHRSTSSILPHPISRSGPSAVLSLSGEHKIERLSNARMSKEIMRESSVYSSLTSLLPTSLSAGSEAKQQGWLTKQGDTFKTWNRRWCLIKDGFIVYYKSKTVCSFKLQFFFFFAIIY